jgi:hypothetical protein
MSTAYPLHVEYWMSQTLLYITEMGVWLLAGCFLGREQQRWAC